MKEIHRDSERDNMGTRKVHISLCTSKPHDRGGMGVKVVLVQLLEGIKGEETGARIGNDTHHSGPHPSVQPA